MATAKKVVRRLKIRRGVRSKVAGTTLVPRLSVFKSNKCIYAQVIDDSKGSTVCSVSSLKADVSGTKVEVANAIGKMIGEATKASGVDKVVFDRSGYLYHGRVKALADGAREAGLKF
jgi:large subunit ribosomal protein L18